LLELLGFDVVSILGAILGGAAGFALGGPLGALVGAAAGHAAQRFSGAEISNHSDGSTLNDQATRKISFTIGVIVLGAKMAKADGRVTEDEIRVFRRVFRTSPEEERNVAKLFNQAKRDTYGFEAYARQLNRVLEGVPEVKEQVIDCLFEIAKADGKIHAKEAAFLQEVARLMGVSSLAFSRLRNIHVGDDERDPYAILGLSQEEDPQIIKSHYRQLVRDHHPDKLTAEGMPEEAIEIANQKLARINAAYDEISKARGIR
jgi:DnaJ like chaperone protein